MFQEIILKAVRLMKKNLNLAQLIFLLFVIVSLFAPTFVGVKINIKIIPIIIIWYALLAAFFAGLFYAFRKAVDYDTEPPKVTNDMGLSPLYFAEFFQGIGCYIKKFLAAGLLLLSILLFLGLVYDYFISHYVVIPESFFNIKSAELLANDALMMEFVKSLSVEDTAKIAKLSLLTIFITSVFGYFTMLYPVILVSTDENIFKAFVSSVKILFRDFVTSFVIFFFFNLALLMIAIISGAVASNIILSVISILLQCYCNVLYLLSLFVYYEKVK